MEEGVCGAERGGGVVRREEGRVFYGVEDVEIGEGADDGEEDDSLYWCVRGVQRKRPQEKAHCKRAEFTRTISPTTFYLKLSLQIKNNRPRPPLY